MDLLKNSTYKVEAKCLDLSWQRVTDIISVSEWSNDLTSLNLSFTSLKKFPVEILKLSNLKELNLSGNRINYLPDDLYKLENLETLRLCACSFDNFPSEIKTLKKLIRINFSDNNFRMIPKWIGDLENIRELYISNCGLKSFPKLFDAINKLEILDLSHNSLSTIGDEIGLFKSLKALKINNNNITKISPQISNLIYLELLDLSRNLLINIPNTFQNLISVLYLKLNSNNINFLPIELGNLKDVQYINIEHNPIENIPREIIQRGTKAIISFLDSALKSYVNKIYEAKTIFVGYGEVGKTSLIKKLLKDQFSIDHLEPATRGVDVESWYFNSIIDGKEIIFKTNMWDFGGQEIYYAMHQFFLTRRSLYILVWNARKDDSYENFDYWLNAISLLSEGCPIIIVQNKIDIRIREIDQKLIKEKFKNVIGFHQVSCLTDDGIKTLRINIQKALENLPHVGDPWPNPWSMVRSDLEILKTDFFRYEDYLKICHKRNVSLNDSEHLSRYLHDIGAIINYRDDYILRNIVVLNPLWITKAVYAAIDSDEILKSDGSFSFDTISKTWAYLSYDPQVHPYLLKAMIKYELCYSIEENEYTIPQLLPERKPSFYWPTNDIFKFRYRYEFMPAGIVNRFTVRNHCLIRDDIKWRYGVVIKDDFSEALIASDPFSKSILIEIYGKNKRDMLGMIRSEITKINKSLKSPKVFEEVPCGCEDPFVFDYNFLRRCIAEGHSKILCYKCTKYVNLNEILSEVPLTTDSISIEKQNVYFGGHMEVKNLSNYGNAIIGERIQHCTISSGSFIDNLKQLVDAISTDKNEKEDLFQTIDKLNNTQVRDEKVKLKNKIEEFLMKYSGAIGSSALGSLLVELGKFIL